VFLFLAGFSCFLFVLVVHYLPRKRKKKKKKEREIEKRKKGIFNYKDGVWWEGVNTNWYDNI
jgi:hypothetical protein